MSDSSMSESTSSNVYLKIYEEYNSSGEDKENVWYFTTAPEAEIYGPYNRYEMTKMYYTGDIANTTEVSCDSLNSYQPFMVLSNWFAQKKTCFLLVIPSAWNLINELHPSNMICRSATKYSIYRGSPIYMNKGLYDLKRNYWYNQNYFNKCPMISISTNLRYLCENIAGSRRIPKRLCWMFTISMNHNKIIRFNTIIIS